MNSRSKSKFYAIETSNHRKDKIQPIDMTNSRLEHLPGQPKFLQMFRDPAEEIIEDTVEDSEESSYIAVDDDDDERWSIESESSFDSGVVP